MIPFDEKFSLVLVVAEREQKKKLNEIVFDGEFEERKFRICNFVSVEVIGPWMKIFIRWDLLARSPIWTLAKSGQRQKAVQQIYAINDYVSKYDGNWRRWTRSLLSVFTAFS